MRALWAAIAAVSLFTTPLMAGTGIETTVIGSKSKATAYGAVVLSSGKIAVTGRALNSTNDVAVAQYTTNGALDSSFGSGGTVMTAIGKYAETGSAIGVQSGKLVVGGDSVVASSGGSLQYDKFASLRYGSTGSLDASYGNRGTVVTALSSTSDAAHGMVIQSDNKIVLAGYAASGADVALVRYTSSGALDSTFGSGGKAVENTGNGSSWNAIALQSNGSLVTAGSITNSMVVARYTSSGAPDPTFNGTGKVTIPNTSGSAVQAIAIQSDGHIVAVGAELVIRLDSSGNLDTTFNGTGEANFALAPSSLANARGVIIQADGKIVVAGDNEPFSGGHQFQLVRYNTDGTVDTTYGSGGVVLTAINDNAEGNGLLLQPADGKVLVFGFADSGTVRKFAIARYNTDGTLDTTW